MKFITDANFAHQKILLRLDLDVPLKNGQITDDTRLRCAFPTIDYLQKQKTKIIVIGHLDRPQKKPKNQEKYKLDPVARFFTNADLHIKKLNDCIGPDVSEAVKNIKNNEIVLLENLRFHPEEEKNDPNFAFQLANLTDAYINDAFAAYRPHASIVGLAKLLPTYLGLQFQKEIDNLSRVLKNPKRPVVFIIGGIKKEKLELIPDIAKIADQILVGGKFNKLQTTSYLPAQAGKLQATKIFFPFDNTDNFDIGPVTIHKYQKIIKSAGTIVWAGPVGKFEDKKYENGTRLIGQTIVDNTSAFSVAGGGDTEKALKQFGFSDQIDFVSTGGGAMLYYLGKGTLPILGVSTP